MLKIVGIMLLGVVTGFALKKRKMGWVQKAITVVIWMLLFALGIAVGMNPDIMEHWDTLGVQAALLAIGGVGGSVLLSWIIYCRFFVHDKLAGEDQEERIKD